MLKYSWIESYCLAKIGAEKDYKEEWDAIRYMVRGKMFAFVCSDSKGRAVINVKLEPEYGIALREQYDDIIAGYHMNKTHWNSLYLDGNVPDEIVEKMLDQSHQLIIAGLSKKAQKELNN